jgi:hypothetical protein
VLHKNPLNGARLKNTTAKHWLQGPMTVFEANSYAGDAKIDNVPPGQERLVSYGIDLQLLIDSTKNNQESTLLTGKIAKGVLELQRKQIFTQEYLADNKSDVEKTLIVEHPFRQGWKLVDTDKPIETTATLYRFKGKIPAGKASKLVVKEQTVQAETIAILPADLEQLAFYARAGEIPKDVKAALSQAIEMRRTLGTTERQINEHKEKIKEIMAQQTHNTTMLQTLQQNTPLYQRLVGKINDLQTELEKQQTELDELTKTAQQQKNDLDAFIAGLNVG